MPYSELNRARSKSFIKELKAKTFCAHCGGQPVEFHHKNPKDPSNRAVAHLVVLGFPVARIKAELKKCEALCRSCHMTEDGRLAAFAAAHPLEKGKVYVLPKPCKKCGDLYKPLRLGFCDNCYKRFKGVVKTLAAPKRRKV